MTDDRSSSRERDRKRQERPAKVLHAPRSGRSNLRRLVKLGYIDPEDALDLEQDYYAELDNEREDET